jgi:hypothetical protein
MKIKSLTILFFSFICAVNFAQNSLDFEFAGVYHNKYSYGMMDYNARMTTDSLGNHYIISNYNGSHDLDPSANEELIETLTSEGDIFLAKYTANGQLDWSKTIQPTPGTYVSDIHLDGLGNIYISGTYADSVRLDFGSSQVFHSPGYNKCFLAKYTNNGTLAWFKLLNTSGDLKFNLDPNNELIATCTYQYTLNIGSLNNPQVITGGVNNIVLMKIGSNGNVIWYKSSAAPSNLMIGGIGSDGDGNSYTAGVFTGSLDTDLDAGTHVLSTNAWTQEVGTYLCKYDLNGNHIWGELITGSGGLMIFSFEVNKSGEFALSGQFGGEHDFDVSSGQKELEASGTASRFLVKYDASCSIIYANKIASSISSSAVFKKVILTDEGSCYALGSKQYTIYTENDTVSNIGPSYNWLSDLVRLKFDSVGEVVQHYLFETTQQANNYNEGFSYGFDISLGQDGNPVVLGEVAGEVDLDQTADSLYPPISSSYFLASFFNNGEINWCSFIGKNPRNSQETTIGLVFDEHNGYFVTGEYRTEVDLDFSQNIQYSEVQRKSISSYLCHYNENNELVWAQSFAGNNALAGVLFEPVLDSAGNVIIALQYTGPLAITTPLNNFQDTIPNHETRKALLKFNPNGGLIWAKKIFTEGYDEVRFSDLEVNVNNEIFITGYFNDTLDFNLLGTDTSVVSNGYQDLFVTRLNANGDIIWFRSFGGSNEDQGFQLLPDGATNFYLSGVFSGSVNFSLNGGTNMYTSPNSRTTFFAKYSNSGNLGYVKMLAGNYPPRINDLKKDQLGNLIFVGNLSGTVDVDPSTSIHNLTSLGSWNSLNAFVTKYSGSGQFLWGKLFTSPYSGSTAKTCIVDSTDNILVGGEYYGEMRFSDSPGSYRESSGLNDLYLAYITKNGQFEQGFTFNSWGDASMEHITYSDGLIGIAGSIHIYDVDFDPSAAINKYRGSQSTDGFVAKYQFCTSPSVSILWNFITMTASVSGVEYQWIDAATNEAIPGATQQSFTPTEDGSYYVAISTADGCSASSQTLDIVNLGLEEVKKGQIILYPNPTSSLITIKTENSSENYYVSVYSLSGAPILTRNLNGNATYDLDASEWSQGVYLIRLDSENDSQVFKIIKN